MGLIDLLIAGGLVVTLDAQRRVLAPGYVAVDQGVIVAVGPGTYPGSAREHIDASDMVVLPGLVNAHNHLDQSVYRSVFEGRRDSRDLIFRMARGLTRQRAQAAAALSLLELVRYGVTTTHESHWTHYHLDSTDGVCDAILQSGLRAVVARSMNDNALTPPDFRETIPAVLADLDRLAAAYDSDRLQIIPEPTTVLRCTPDAIHAMRGWAVARGKLWHIHLAQTPEELADALAALGMGSVQYVHRLGALSPAMLAAHCVGLLDEEVDLLADHGVRIAHCPATVIRGGWPVPPIWDLARRGAIVAIATDGAVTNNGQNIWEAMKLAVYMQRVRYADRWLGTAEQALEMATIQAARALDMDDRVGSLEPGKAADLALFSRRQPHLLPDAMLIPNLVYSGLDNRADTVIVGGRVILRGGRSVLFDEAEVMARAREAQAALLREAGLDGEIGLSQVWPAVHAAT